MILHDNPNDIEYGTAMRLQIRATTEQPFHKFEGYAAEIFSAMGLDLNTLATKDMPRRFIKELIGHQIADAWKLCGIRMEWLFFLKCITSVWKCKGERNIT